MSELLNTQEIMTWINQLIDNSQRFICLVSPFINLDREQMVMLEDASSRNVPITVIYRQGADKQISRNNDSFDFLKSVPAVKLFACPELHAKIYANEDYALLTSRNLYTAQEGCSIETGVYYENADPVYEGLRQIVDRLKRISKQVKQLGIKEPKSEMPECGFCIKCGKKIPYSPYDKPLCQECNNDYEEKGSKGSYRGDFCHRCGKEWDVRVRYPLDHACWEIDRRNRQQMW